MQFLRPSLLVSDRPKPEFKPKPKYRNFGLVWTETETETERRSIPKPKPKPKLLFSKLLIYKVMNCFIVMGYSDHNKLIMILTLKFKRIQQWKLENFWFKKIIFAWKLFKISFQVSEFCQIIISNQIFRSLIRTAQQQVMDIIFNYFLIKKVQQNW